MMEGSEEIVVIKENGKCRMARERKNLCGEN